jgi:hypothetical protein
MTFGRHKRLLLGFLALLAPLPLPLNDVIGWPALIGYWLAVGLFLYRAWMDTGGWLPNWAMNLLAIGYLPLFALDLGVLWRGRILQPVVHLLLFALAVKLFSLKREKDKWQTVLVLVFLFLAATGTSVHPAVLLYVVTFLAGMLLLLSRFVAYDMLAVHARRAPMVERVPLRGFVSGGVIFTLVAAIPLFIFLPRLRSPYVMGPGGGYGELTQVATFQDEMRLDGVGRVRGSRAVVMRLSYESPPPPTHGPRVKVMTYDIFVDDQWQRRARAREGLRTVARQPDGYFALGPGRVESWMEAWMEPFSGRNLGIPVDGVELDLIPTAVESFVTGVTGPNLLMDGSGVVSLPFPRDRMVRYRVGLARGDRLAVGWPATRSDLEAAVDSSHISPAIAELAGQVMGEGEAGVRAERAERYLSTSLEYTTDLIGTPEGEKIETFLFDIRRGHCELFATSMVLMLRSQGIPARLAAGFLGAEYNPIEGYYIVRQSNAHAWVEAFVEGAGWQVYDPTPAAGRPTGTEAGWSALAAQLYDYLVFRWDRYILTFGLADQVGLVASLRDLWQSVSAWFASDPAAAPEIQQTSPPRVPALALEADPAERDAPAPWLPLTVALALVTAGFLWLQRRRFDATAAYVRLRERLRPEFGRRLESVPPLAVAGHLAERFPRTERPARRLVDLYLTESFGGRRLSAAEVREARRLLRQALSRKAV